MEMESELEPTSQLPPIPKTCKGKNVTPISDLNPVGSGRKGVIKGRNAKNTSKPNCFGFRIRPLTSEVDRRLYNQRMHRPPITTLPSVTKMWPHTRRNLRVGNHIKDDIFRPKASFQVQTQIVHSITSGNPGDTFKSQRTSFQSQLVHSAARGYQDDIFNSQRTTSQSQIVHSTRPRIIPSYFNADDSFIIDDTTVLPYHFTETDEENVLDQTLYLHTTSNDSCDIHTVPSPPPSTLSPVMMEEKEKSVLGESARPGKTAKDSCDVHTMLSQGMDMKPRSSTPTPVLSADENSVLDEPEPTCPYMPATDSCEIHTMPSLPPTTPSPVSGRGKQRFKMISWPIPYVDDELDYDYE